MLARPRRAGRNAPGPPATAPAGHEDHWLGVAALALAAVALGYANQTAGARALPWLTTTLGGHVPWLATALEDRRFPWLTIALIAATAALALPRIARIELLGANPAALILAGGVAFQLYQLWITPPDSYLVLREAADYETFAYWLMPVLVIAGLFTALGLFGPPHLRRAAVPPLLLTHFLLGAWLIGHAAQGQNDVFIFQQDGAAALLRGENPYALTFPDLYGAEGLPFYGPGLTADGRTTFGFPYPPLSLFLALPGQLLGDPRYAQLAALTLAGALIAYVRPGRLGVGAAALLLFTPRIFHILDQGWTEPFVVCLLAATIYCACRAPRFLPIALGLFLASKQYLIVVAPLTLLLLPRPLRWRDLWALGWRAGLTALVVSLPLALWDPAAFGRSVVVVQFLQPLRLDALSYPAMIANAGGPHLPTWVTFAAVLPPIGLAFWRRAQTPSAYAAAVALTCLAFFAFSKQAFNNYYFLVLGALSCAIAAAQPAGLAHDEREGVPPAGGKRSRVAVTKTRSR